MDTNKPEVLFSNLHIQTEENIRILTLDHEAKRNPLSEKMLSDLHHALEEAREDRNLRILILRASGPVFSAGHDLREMVGRSEAEYESLFARCTAVMEAIRLHPLPVIAEVAGMATAAGCQLVASCDLVVAAEDATFATPGVKIGLFCSTPAVAIGRVLPTKKAMEMLLTGAPISARDAERFGMINRVVPRESLSEETLRLARQIITASPYTLSLGKRIFYEQLNRDRPAAYRLAERAMVENALAPDGQEGMQAFLEKRQPHWRT